MEKQPRGAARTESSAGGATAGARRAPTPAGTRLARPAPPGRSIFFRDASAPKLRDGPPARCSRTRGRPADEYIRILLTVSPGRPSLPEGNAGPRAFRGGAHLRRQAPRYPAQRPSDVHQLRLVFDEIGAWEPAILQYAGRFLHSRRKIFGPAARKPFLEILRRQEQRPENGDGPEALQEIRVPRPMVFPLEDVSGALHGVLRSFASRGNVAGLLHNASLRTDPKVFSPVGRLALGPARPSPRRSRGIAGRGLLVLHLGDHNLSGGHPSPPGARGV